MKYTAVLSGASWSHGPSAEFWTIRAARQWAEQYGTSADACTISDSAGRVVGEHRRDTSGEGSRWYRAQIAQGG